MKNIDNTNLWLVIVPIVGLMLLTGQEEEHCLRICESEQLVTNTSLTTNDTNIVLQTVNLSKVFNSSFVKVIALRCE